MFYFFHLLSTSFFKKKKSIIFPTWTTDDHAGHVSQEQILLVCELQHCVFDNFHGVDRHFRQDA